MNPVLSAAERTMGTQLVLALLDRQDWSHRKVDSIRLFEGDLGQRRQSLDCTPPEIVSLPEHTGVGVGAGAGGGDAPLLLPISIVTKGVLRDLNVRDAEGRPLPVLGTEDNARAALAALWQAIRPRGREAPAVREMLTYLVGPDRELAQGALHRLLGPHGASGEPDERHPALRSASTDVRELMETLASGFLLLALIPGDARGRRQVIKISYNWSLDPKPSSKLEALLVALGHRERAIGVEVPGAADARSYHLEVHAPGGLTCTALILPAGDPAAANSAGVDRRPGSVVHATGRYVGGLGTGDAAELTVAVPRWRGAHLTALLTSAFTATVFLLAELLPGGREALNDAEEGAAAVLLAAPGVAVALLVRAAESDLAVRVLRPLRVIVLGNAVALAAGAASLVGALHEPWQSWQWWTTALATLAVTLALAIPWADLSDRRSTPNVNKLDTA